MSEYLLVTKRKIALYFASNYLFGLGKSYPQVIEILSDYETDIELLNTIVEQARVDHWRRIYNEVQRLLSEGKTYQEIVEGVKHMESDDEIIHFIVNSWYRVKVAYIDNLVESPTNIYEGVQWAVISALGIAVVFYFGATLVSKIIWIVSFIAALITWLYGLRQKRIANGLKKILEYDYSAFEEMI